MRQITRCTAFFVVFGFLIKQVIAEKPTTESAPFGMLPTGEVVQQFTLRNSHGMQAKIIEFGAIISELSVPDKDGKFGNVLLSSNSLETYLKGFPAAAVMGRYGGRIGGGRFMLDVKLVQVTKNSGGNHIHGGQKHFGKVLWKGSKSENDASVELKYTSLDGEEGFPGTLQVSVTYSVSESNELKIHYKTSTDKTTVINLTNHAYFNLAGSGSDVLGHALQIDADRFAVVDKSMIPTGELAAVEQTVLDFRTPHLIGERIEKLYGELGGTFSGYDHTFAIRGEIGSLRFAAKVTEPKSGRVMECFTTEPAVQLFTANSFNNNPFPKHGGFCLETQHYPDSPNRSEFPSVVLAPGVSWTSTTVYRFTVQEKIP